MKMCKNCNYEAKDDANFCIRCGSKEFVVPWQPPNDQLQYTTAGTVSRGFSAPPTKKKSSVWWKVALAVICFFVVVAVLVILSSESNVPYDIGSFSGNTYTNEWAGIEVEIPSDFDVDEQLSSEEGVGDMAFAAGDYMSKSMMIAYFKKEDYATEEALLEKIAEGMDVDFDKPSKEKLAGNSYNTYVGTESEDYDSIDLNIMHYKAYIREKDDRYILILCAAKRESQFFSLTSLIKEIK